MIMGYNFQNICQISPQAANRSVLITGISGAGKTCCMQRLELDSLRAGHAVIVLDTNHSHDSGQIFEPLRPAYEAASNRISACVDGLDIPLLPHPKQLSTFCVPPKNFINQTVQAIAKSVRLGVDQAKTLRSAMQAASNQPLPSHTEIERIGYALNAAGSKGERLYERLWPLFNCDVLRPSQKPLLRNRINLIDLSSLDSETQMILVELLLSNLWLRVRNNPSNSIEYDLFLDETQRLHLGKDSMVSQLLREGRKFHLNLILATQSLSLFPTGTVAMLEQAATKLYFRPDAADLTRIARKLGTENSMDWKKELLRLQVGEVHL